VFVDPAKRLGFKRHPTLRALARMVLFYLRMHAASRETGAFEDEIFKMDPKMQIYGRNWRI
jgi:hypothetical protein